jgi:hypothetical protein
LTLLSLISVCAEAAAGIANSIPNIISNDSRFRMVASER